MGVFTDKNINPNMIAEQTTHSDQSSCKTSEKISSNKIIIIQINIRPPKKTKNTVLSIFFILLSWFSSVIRPLNSIIIYYVPKILSISTNLRATYSLLYISCNLIISFPKTVLIKLFIESVIIYVDSNILCFFPYLKNTFPFAK